MAILRIILKTLLLLITTVVVLPIALVAALYVPPIQHWAVQTAARYASEATGMDISIERLRIHFPLDIDLQGLVVAEKGDTIVTTQSAVVDLELKNVRDMRIGVESIDLSHGSVNIALKEDTTETDTTKTQMPDIVVDIKRVRLSDIKARYRSVGDTLTVYAAVREATLEGGDIALGPSLYKVDDFEATVDSLCISTLDSAGTRTTLFPPDLSPLDYRLTPFTVSLKELSLELPSLLFTLHSSLFTPSVNVSLKAAGNLQSLTLGELHVWLPDELDITAHGTAENITDMDSLTAQIEWDVKTQNLTNVRRYLGMQDINLPPMNLNALTKANGKRYDVDAILHEGCGNARVKARYDATDESYEAQARINAINVRDFLPKDSIGTVSVTAKMRGTGTDIYSPSTEFAATLSLERLQYGAWDVRNVNATAQLRHNVAELHMTSCNRLLEAAIAGRTRLSRNGITGATLDIQVAGADLRALRLTQDTLSVATALTAQASSNFADRHQWNADISHVAIHTPDTTYQPLPLHTDGLLAPDTMHVHASSGDLLLTFDASDGLSRLLRKTDNINRYLKEQMSRSIEKHQTLTVSHDTLKTMLPTFDLTLSSQRANTLHDFISSIGFSIEDVAARLSSDTTKGLNGKAHIYGFEKGETRLDTIGLNLSHDSRGFNIVLALINGPENPTATFSSTLRASLQPAAIEASLDFLDAKGRKGVDLGMRMEGRDSTLMAHITPRNPVLAYRQFTVNEDNYLSIDPSRHIRADFNLKADDGTQIILSSPKERNDDVLQDLTLSLRHLNLGELADVMPFVMPDIKGYLDGDMHALIVDTTEASVAVDMTAHNLVYEQAPLGDVGLNMVWLPNPDGTQIVDGSLTQGGREVMQLGGKYWKDKQTQEDNIRATATLKRLPLLLANGFIPNNIVQLDGYAVGKLAVEGPLSALKLNGTLATDSMDIRSTPYSVHLALPADTIYIKDSQLELRNMRAFSVVDKGKERPDLDIEHAMRLNGRVNFQDLQDIRLGMRIQAENFRLIDAPRNKKAQTYGKAYVDADVMLGGNLKQMRLGGKLRLLGKTDLTYVMTDTPLSAESQLDELVTFCDLSDTTAVDAEKTDPMDIRLNLTLSIDEAATVHALLSEDGSDNVEIEGGGEMSFSYDPINGNRLYGRYTILSGSLNYSLVVASLKDFKIQNGSYIEFAGDPMNPTLSLAASERKKATVTEGKVSRTVQFDVGLKVSRNLKDLGLEFTIEAPEDLSCQQELAAMSDQQRGRVAVTLLATGMYITDNYQSSGGGFQATDALNSFLQSQINSIAGKALKTVDIGFGMDNTTNETGTSQTDYNFSFAKRFWGNRISVIIGGKVSSGNNVQNTGESIINNVSVEYRLDGTGTRYVRAFYDRDYESLMEGTITKMGAGLVFRRKTATLGELFLFKTKK